MVIIRTFTGRGAEVGVTIFEERSVGWGDARQSVAKAAAAASREALRGAILWLSSSKRYADRCCRPDEVSPLQVCFSGSQPRCCLKVNMAVSLRMVSLQIRRCKCYRCFVAVAVVVVSVDRCILENPK